MYTQAIRDVGQLVQATQASLQSSITGQAAMMEILKSIKAHCDQENNWWMEIMRVRSPQEHPGFTCIRIYRRDAMFWLRRRIF